MSKLNKLTLLALFQSKSAVASGSREAATVSHLKTAESCVELNGIINPHQEGGSNGAIQSGVKRDVIKSRPGVIKVKVENTDSMSTVQSTLSDTEVQLVGKR